MKRMDDSFHYNKNKRQKIQDVDDIWGDDPEIEEVDRCIDLATQICSQSEPGPSNALENSSFLVTNYNHFKQKSSLVASTQAFRASPFLLNSTENNSTHEIPILLNKLQILESEKKKVSEEYETRKGEIAFLRAQLKQAQNDISKEKMERLKLRQQNQEIWDEKLSIKNKELDTLKCENELKTLEAANLRQKLTEVKKVYNSNLNLSLRNEEQCSTTKPFMQRKSETDKKKLQSKTVQTVNHFAVYSHKNTFYPYRKLYPCHLLFNCDTNLLRVKLRNISENLLHNQHNFSTTLFENNINKNLLPYNMNLQNDIFQLFLKFSNYSEDEINNSDDIIEFVTNLQKYTKEYLLYFLIKLLKWNKTFQLNKSKNSINLYLDTPDIEYNSDCLFSDKLWSEFELEIDVRRLIAIYASLCQHSNIFYSYLLKQLNNNFNVNDLENLDTINFNLDRFQEMDFLQIILQLTIFVKINCLTEQLCGFFAATLKLLSFLIHKEILPPNCYKLIFEIFKQILFAQPNQPVLQYICYFLKYVSEHHHFMSLLCTRRKSNGTQIKDGLLIFSDETCTLKILSSLIETCKLKVDIASNLMCFLRNLVTCNVYWMHLQDQRCCGCLNEIYGLGICILYKSLDKFTSYQKDHKDTRPFLIIFHVGLLFLHVLTVRIPDLVAKSSRLYSQYQTIIKFMYEMRDYLQLANKYETELNYLLSQLNYDVQNESGSKNCTTSIKANYYFNCNFINF